MAFRDKPVYCYQSGCPLADKGKGFALGAGDPKSAIAILFERPADDELSYTFGGPRPPKISEERWKEELKWQKEEYERRRLAFPELDNEQDRKFLLRGAPVRGASGAELNLWVFPMAGGGRLEDYFLENVLHCASPKNEYPKGEDRKLSESCCAHWNQLIKFGEPTTPNAKPFTIDVSVVSLHPAGLIKDVGGGIVALPLQVDTFAKARAFVKAGKKVLILAGGKASYFWSHFAEAVTRWCGHFTWETEETWQRRMNRILLGQQLATMPESERKKKKSRKKKAPESMELFPESTETTGMKRRKRAPKIPGMGALGL